MRTSIGEPAHKRGFEPKRLWFRRAERLRFEVGSDQQGNIAPGGGDGNRIDDRDDVVAVTRRAGRNEERDIEWNRRWRGCTRRDGGERSIVVAGAGARLVRAAALKRGGRAVAAIGGAGTGRKMCARDGKTVRKHHQEQRGSNHHHDPMIGDARASRKWQKSAGARVLTQGWIIRRPVSARRPSRRGRGPCRRRRHRRAVRGFAGRGRPSRSPRGANRI